VFGAPPPTEYCIFMCLLGRIFNPCGLLAEYVLILLSWHFGQSLNVEYFFVGPVAFYTVMFKKKLSYFFIETVVVICEVYCSVIMR
jgi:hypothetical protein